MVNVVSAVSLAQNIVLKPSVQSEAVATAPPQASTSDNIDYVTSGIVVDNLQNIAILEYRSSQTGDIIQQYPNQAQINAFKAAERLAHAASTSHQAEVETHHAAVAAPVVDTQEEVHVSIPSTGGSGVPISGSSGGSSSETGSSGGKTTSVIA